MKYFNRKIAISGVIMSVILLSGCASTSGPTSNVGIVNGKYAVQTVVPNNNKGKKVNFATGQRYACETQFQGNAGEKILYTFDLTTSQDGQSIVWDNDKQNGKSSDTSYIGKLVYKPNVGFVETTKGKTALLLSQNNTGTVMSFKTEKDMKTFLRVMKETQEAGWNEKEFRSKLIANKVQAYQAVCTQMTNNPITHTRYLTDHEIDAYKHGQQIAVQQRAIDSANYNATMSRIQAQNAQMNYNTQQMLNRMNTYNVNIVGY